MTQLTTISKRMSTDQVIARFMELKEAFKAAGVNPDKTPIVTLVRGMFADKINDRQARRLTMALSGRASSKDAALLPFVERTLELKRSA